MKHFETDLRNGADGTRPGSGAERLRTVLISNDDGLRGIVSESILRGDLPITIGLDVVPPPRPLDSDHLEQLRGYDPQAVILDMGDDPEGAVRNAGAIASAVPGAAVVGLGPELDAAILLDAMRAGIVEYVPGPLDATNVGDALQRVLRKRGLGGSLNGRRNGQVLAFFSPKGGAGSTTVITNTGIELHRLTGKRTILVDLDLELGEIASQLGVQPRFHFVDLVRNIHRMDADLLASYIESHSSGVHVLSAPFEPEAGEVVGVEEIFRILAFLRSHYDYVLVDTSKSLAPPTLAALEMADTIFLVSNMDVPSLRNLKRCLPILNRVTAGDARRIRLVVNRFNARSLVRLEDLEETLGIEVYRTLVNDFDTVITSISTGQPLVLQGSSRYAKEVRALAGDIAGGGNGRADGRNSLVGRLLSRLGAGSSPVEQPARLTPAEVSAHV